MAASAARLEFWKGSFVFRQGDPARFFFVVQEGSVKVHATSLSGKTVTFSIAVGGDTLNASALWMDALSLSAQALSSVTAIRIGREKFFDFIGRFPSLAREIIPMLEFRLKAEYERRVDVLQGEVYSRVTQSLLVMAMKFGPVIHLRRHEFAEYVGTTKETAIRVLSTLKKRNVIGSSSRRGEIIISDLPRLARLAGQR
jgi:CRP-like cAMP-binding protein